MTEGPRRIPVVDRRVSQREPQAAEESEGHGQPATDEEPVVLPDDAQTPVVGRAEVAQGQTDFLDDLKRLQADFDNYRKRMMREQAATATRAKARLMEQLLPVLDDFERALEHDDSNGMELIYKQLRSTLEAEGLEEIEAEGKPFDPNWHEAVDSREDPDVGEIVVRSVFRRGYRVGDQVLRAAMVVVARPPEAVAETEDVAEGSDKEEISEAGG